MPTITHTTPRAPATGPRRSTSTRRRVGVGALSLLCAVPAGALLRPPTDPSGYAGPHVARFDGVDANGLDLVWRGRIGDAASGDSAELRLVLAPRGSASDAALPTPWAMEGVLFVAGAPDRSFAADVVGTIDWQARRAHLQGVVSVGRRVGDRVVYVASVSDFDLRGDLRTGMTTLARRAESPRPAR